MMDEKAFSADNYFLWWCLSGGIPKYIEWLAVAKTGPINLLIKSLKLV
jgi:hypothetical protein